MKHFEKDVRSKRSGLPSMQNCRNDGVYVTFTGAGTSYGIDGCEFHRNTLFHLVHCTDGKANENSLYACVFPRQESWMEHGVSVCTKSSMRVKPDWAPLSRGRVVKNLIDISLFQASGSQRRTHGPISSTSRWTPTQSTLMWSHRGQGQPSPGTCNHPGTRTNSSALMQSSLWKVIPFPVSRACMDFKVVRNLGFLIWKPAT